MRKWLLCTATIGALHGCAALAVLPPSSPMEPGSDRLLARQPPLEAITAWRFD